jgi:tartrate dehydratase alpha subunit/fumarate hydratase class I-like protein
MDAFRMAVGKQVRDGIRGIEQQLHAGVGEAVTRQTRRMSAAADSFRGTAEDGRRTEQALADIDADLETIRELQLRAGQLVDRSAGVE